MSLAPRLFMSKERRYETDTWYLCLSENSQIYEDCVVKSLVHVKNFITSAAHETIHATIVNTSTGAHTRIMAERHTDYDWVTLGRWGSTYKYSTSKSTKGSRSKSECSATDRNRSLSLRSLYFPGDDFKVIHLAEILEHSSKMGGPYNPFTRNCYWFASSVYTKAKRDFSGVETLQPCHKWQGLPRFCFNLFEKKRDDAARALVEEIEWEMIHGPKSFPSP
ncbi:hypothetical protein F5Y11DRAFT_343158 [Daldinia sp. FL1419]|nr:hypothetical protein F5Y11DRAFT_343158 [Daldinia sp. FL1419]